MHNGTQGSRIAGFSRLGRDDRLASLVDRAGLADGEVAELLNGALSFEAADHVIENAIGVLGLPLGVGLNFLINCQDRLVPMAIEEPSVVAAASYAARLAARSTCWASRTSPRRGNVSRPPRCASSRPRMPCIRISSGGAVARGPSSSGSSPGSRAAPFWWSTSSSTSATRWAPTS